MPKVKKTLNFPATLKPTKDRAGRYFFTDIGKDFPFPDLIEVQTRSYWWFVKNGIHELIDEINPITDPTGKKLRLEVMSIDFEDPKNDIETCKVKGLNYESVIRAHVALTNLESGEIKEQDVYFGQIPVITDSGTFVINGIERIIVSQIVRSPGIFYLNSQVVTGKFQAKMIPKRGAWLEAEADKKGLLWIKIDRKRKIPVSMFLRAFGYETNEEIIALFKDQTKDMGEENPILKTLAKDDSVTPQDAWQGVYKRIRPGDLATPDNAHAFIKEMFFNFRKYDLGPIARHKINEKFDLKTKSDRDGRIFRIEDFIWMIRDLIVNNRGEGEGKDDIDHLCNRRIRGVGELIQNKFRIGLLRTERIIRDRMSIVELDTVTPSQIVNCRPVTAAMHEFFASSQLSQFMDQTNPLACLEHKRRISAMGPGGLSRERAGFDVRDVHPSHYGRICPVSTPEGPNIGLVIHLASYAKVNEFGFIETPYRTVAHTVKNDGKSCIGRRASQNVLDGKKTIVEKDQVLSDKDAAALAKMKDVKVVSVRAYITEEVCYYNANEEKHLCVAQANAVVNEHGEFIKTEISARNGFKPGAYHESMITHMDIAPQQIISISTSLISFLEHDDNTRALMGSNMQRQAVPLIRPAAPLIGTGVEHIAASDQSILAPEEGEIKSVDATRIEMVGKSGKKYTFDLQTFARTNQSTAIHQRPRVDSGDTVQKGDVLIDGASVQDGELAVGQNLLVAYMPWRGLNFEDAVIVSDRIVKDGVFNSLHIDDYEMDVRDTKLGAEELTADIPNVGAHKLKDLDEHGIIRIGATILSGDILAGKVTPKGETELSAEDRLLRAIFGEKAHDVRDTSLRLPRGSGGKVIKVEVLDRKNGDELPNGVLKRVKVYMAQMRHLESGDKMAGRHGNKGVISRIIPVEDMPYTEDGRAIDIILNPLGVSARMNIGQILETHLGLAAEKMGIKIATPALNGIKLEQIREFLKANDLPEDGKMQLFDGQTGEAFDQRTVVGICYMLKLIHMVEDKVHARSVGPYSLVTQQPFGGKAQNGGQRFGEMEVWALEAHGAAHTLQEMLTIKSDDVKGRSACYESIVKSLPIEDIGIPESFNVLIKELQSLCLKVDVESGGQKMSIQELEKKVEQARRDDNAGDDKKDDDKSSDDKKSGDDATKKKKKDETQSNDDKSTNDDGHAMIEESSDVSVVLDESELGEMHEVNEDGSEV